MIDYPTLFLGTYPANFPTLWIKEDIVNLIERNMETLSSDFRAAMEDTVDKYSLMPQKKGPLAFVYISWLRTPALLQKPLLRIDLYDSRELADLEECSATWDISCVSKGIYTRLPTPEGRLKSGALTPIDIEKIWVFEAEKLCTVLGEYIPELTQSVREDVKYNKVKFFYGQYLDQVLLVE